MTLPLEGVKALDLSWQGPGPYCTMLLADLGADVLRVQEPAVSGRRAAAAAGTAATSAPELESMRAVNDVHGRNKRSITLNLKAPEARDIFYALVKQSDVVVEGFRPGVAKRLSVDYETLAKINPRVVYCSITGYGQDGPYAGLVGHDVNYISIAGALSIIGEPGGKKPAIPMNLVADYGGGGMQAAFGICVALLAREKTGRGQQVDVSLTDSVLSLLAQAMSMYFQSGVIPGLGDSLLSGAYPHYSVYECKDGKWLSLGCLEPWLYANLCRALGREDFISHQYSDGAKREEIFAAFREAFLGRNRDEWFQYLKDKEVCVGPVYDFAEVWSDPQVQARKMMVELTHPQAGKIRQVGVSPKFSETPGQVRAPAVRRGTNTDEVLKSLGYGAERIAKLREAGAV